MCRELGNGRSGTVYLAYHVELEEYRAVKVVPKSIADYDTFRKEALFLKGTYEASVLSERKVTKRELSTVRLSPKRKRSLEEICASCL